MNKREVGTEYESLACSAFEQEGMTILARNYRVRIGEIDIIADDGGILVFAEVKYRRSKACGGAQYAISEAKKERIRKVARWFMAQYHYPINTFCRFDAVLIDGDEIQHIKNAW